MIKKCIAFVVALVLSFSLAGCGVLNGLLGELSGESSSEHQVMSNPASLPPPKAVSIPGPTIVSEEEPQRPEIALVPEALAMIGQPNSLLRQINGNDCETYIMYGGTPVADYTYTDVPLPFSFWMEGDFYDAWDEYSDGQGYSPSFNFWPDDLTIVGISVWREMIMPLFQTSSPITYTLMAETYGQAPELTFTAAYEGVNYSYDVDTWAAEYWVDGYTIYATFEQGSGDYQMMDVLITY